MVFPVVELVEFGESSPEAKEVKKGVIAEEAKGNKSMAGDGRTSESVTRDQEGWDTTTKVVNVKNRYYSTSSDRYTEAQKATFTKWVNIQLRTIHVDEETSQKIPEIKAIDRDFRDGKRLIQLLHVLFENDPELPKPERGRTRHHYVANVNKVLQFLQTRLDDSALAALQAIGPVDIVDGNVKLTLGLIWLMISKFRQMVSIFETMSEEAMTAEVEANSSPTDKTTKESEHAHNWLDDLVKGAPVTVITNFSDEPADSHHLDSPMEYEEHNLLLHEQDSSFNSHQEHHVSPVDSYQDFGHHDQESSYESYPEKYDDVSTEIKQTQQEIQNRNPTEPMITGDKKRFLPQINSKRVLPSRLSAESQKAVADKRLSLPPGSFLGGSNNKKIQAPPARFRTLRLDHSTPMSSSSGILFWVNMQLIEYAAILPSSSYPVEDFTGMNDGIILATLIHHRNEEWLEDYDSLIKEDDEHANKKEKIKERLTRCFSILEDKLNISSPKTLISTLIEKEDQNVEHLKRTGLAWSVYMSEVFLAMSEKRRKKATLRGKKRIGRVVINDDGKEPATQVEDTDAAKSKRKKSRGCLPIMYNTRPLFPMPSWSPKASLLSAIFDWTIGWLLNEYDDDDDSDSDDNERAGECEARTIRVGKKRSDGSWNIQDANEWKKKNESLSDNEDVPIELLTNVHQPAVYTHWS
ncbi:4013_t:CDS:2 [Acaulospora morrowiae]|uniref:4013_t:CDS:1 n=1 Tax=Acaulospora morrowiae TaxID=94023 RepID=A0A9N9GPG6_9GLOM|nr:4013_t:CDS:2 [Acaulospora morrowiae]